jgi:hypothetical protein
LRSAQYFDSFDIREIGEGARLKRDGNIVHLNRYAGLHANTERKRADATDRHRSVHGVLSGFDDQ